MIRALVLLVAGVLATHPEGNPDARMLTVAESVGQGERSVYPEQVRLFWTADSGGPAQRSHFTRAGEAAGDGDGNGWDLEILPG